MGRKPRVANHPGRHQERQRVGDVPASRHCSESVLSLIYPDTRENRSTLATLSGQLNKYGDIVKLVKYIDGVPTIFGIPVKIAPSMDSIGASKVPVVLVRLASP